MKTTLATIERCFVWACLLAFCFFTWAMLIGACSRIAHASPLDCEQLHNSDERHFCRAVSIPSKSECEFIHDHDLRTECRARVP